MQTKYSLLTLLAASVIPFRLHAVEPAKDLTLGEKLNAWLKDKEQLTADLAAANQRAAMAEAALATAKSEAAGAATSLAEATGKLAEAEEKATTAQRKAAEALDFVDANLALLASVGFGYQKLDLKDKDGKAIAFPSAEYTNAFQTVWNTHIAHGVTAKMAELGVKANLLPTPVSAEQAESNNLKGLDRVRAAFAAQ